MNKKDYDKKQIYMELNDVEEEEEELAEQILPENVEVIGVKYKDAGKVYYFSPRDVQCKLGQKVIVKTARGLEIGIVAVENMTVSSKEIVPPLRELERIATEDDIERYNRNLELEKEAYRICFQKIQEHGLEMKLIDAKYTFDNSKLLFNFSAEKRIDFRELVKDLASVFRTRIELRQIGIRDEAKLMGGLGICGRPFCCATFLSDFAQVSIKMAKEQNLSLNSSKISGTCGRLMCCLRFESETYSEAIKRMPPVDSKVKSPDGTGIVTEISPLTNLCKVRFADKNDNVTFRTFDASDLEVIEKKAKA